jgi:hypothetical protein
MSDSGHKQTCRDVRPMSALPPKADSGRTSRHVRKVPIPDLPNATAHCAKRTIANLRSAVIAGRAVERTARHLKKAAPFFANCAYLKLGCAAGKHYIASTAGSTINFRWME